jgi:NAD(P)-dependent dehydrogenase (short-subunit alcohol dehydrogenase family)
MYSSFMANIFITGASSGLGLSHAIYLISRGHSVIGTSRNAQKIDRDALARTYLRDHTKFRFIDKEKRHVQPVSELVPPEIKSHLTEYIAKIHFVSLDITKSESIAQTIKDTLAYCQEIEQPLDVLINNAGNGFFGSIEDMPLEQVQQQFDANYFGQIRMIQAFLPYFRSRKQGKIINTSSMAAYIAIPFEAHYAASKAAILRMSEGLRMELAPFHIHVSTICPGDINTNFNANTAHLHGHANTAQSEEIGTLLDNNPVPSSSPYVSFSINPWQRIIQNLIVAPPPLVISKVVAKIVESSKPKMHYTAGSVLQKVQTWLIRRLASAEFSVDGAASFYGMPKQ